MGPGPAGRLVQDFLNQPCRLVCQRTTASPMFLLMPAQKKGSPADPQNLKPPGSHSPTPRLMPKPKANAQAQGECPSKANAEIVPPNPCHSMRAYVYPQELKAARSSSAAPHRAAHRPRSPCRGQAFCTVDRSTRFRFSVPFFVFQFRFWFSIRFLKVRFPSAFSTSATSAWPPPRRPAFATRSWRLPNRLANKVACSPGGV